MGVNMQIAQYDDEARQLRAENERLRHHLIEAEAALWRVYPNTHTVGGNPDPFEGPGETYGDAYHRLREENKRLRAENDRLREVSDE